MPYVQKPLLADTLKYNYLGEPALTMVKGLTDIEEIWNRLIESYGDSGVLLQNKLGALSKMGGLSKIRDDEGLTVGISELLNAMTELKRLAELYNLESRLYHPLGGLGKVGELMGLTRFNRFLDKHVDIPMGSPEEWDKSAQFLELELKKLRNRVAVHKSHQPLLKGNGSSEKSDNSDENSETDDSDDRGWSKGCTNVSVKDEFKAICGICGKRDHKSYVSPFSGNRKICYLACDTLLGMSPLERRQILDDKGFCLQCLTANAKKGHEHCHNTYVCKHPSHDPNSERCHVLVCEKHKDTTDKTGRSWYRCKGTAAASCRKKHYCLPPPQLTLPPTEGRFV